MKDYKTIFEGIEATLFEVGSRTVPREQIRAELEPCKHLEGKRFSDDECYRILVHIIFYSGFKAQIVSDKLPVIDRHFPNYNVVASYGDREVQSILDDPAMIRNRLKIRACVENAKTLKSIVERNGSFQSYVESMPAITSDKELIESRDRFRQLFKFLGERTAFHFMMDIGLPVLKPDRVIEGIFKRIGLVPEDLGGDALYIALIQEGRKFAQATGHAIRYIDIVFVCYGQVQAREVGLERGICVSAEEGGPSCSICGITQHCDYYARTRRSRRRITCSRAKEFGVASATTRPRE